MTAASRADLTEPTTAPDPDLLTVGRVAKAHGLRGEVVVDLWTDQVQRLAPGSVLACGTEAAGGIGSAGTVRVASSRPFGAGRYLVSFEGVGDRAAAERLRGMDLAAPPLEVPGTLWVHELVGAAVRDSSGRALGTVAAVEANPASDLLVLDSGTLIPVRFVTAHEAAARVVEVDIPEGLLDL